MKRQPLLKLFPGAEVRNLGRLLAICCLVGLVAGLGAVAFYWLLEVAKYLFLDQLAGFHPSGPGGEPPLIEPSSKATVKWILFLLPALGGLVSGILVYWLAPEAEGHGTDAAIDSFHHRFGAVRARVPLIKAITSAVTIGTGGSGGREGPIAQIGSGFGSMLGRWLKLRPHERRILMTAGMGAGIGAIFHAPLAGALFSAEVLYKELDLEHEVLVPTVISSIIAYSVFGLVHQACGLSHAFSPLFVTEAYIFNNPAQLLPYFLLALVVAAAAVLYVKSFYSVRDFFIKIPLPPHVKPALGGLVVGAIGWYVPEALGTGYGVVQDCFGASITIGAGTLLVIALAKILTTSFSIGSGGSGGVFGPAIVIGGALGGAVGLFMADLLPGMDIQPGAFVLVGMAGFFGAAANVPISTIIMVSEMTGNYNLLVPSMWVCILAYLIAKKFQLYEKQLDTRFDAPAHLGNMAHSVLKKMTVANVLVHGNPEPVISVSPNMTVRDMLKRFADSECGVFPVLDEHQKLMGQINGSDLRSAVAHPEVGPLIVASEMAHPALTVTAEESLLSAVKKLVGERLEELIVVDSQDQQRVVATMSRNDLITAYNHEIITTIQRS